MLPSVTGDASEPASSVVRRAIRLQPWQRWACLAFGVAAGSGGTAAVFVTKNQVGSTALLLAGGLALLMALTGRVPDRIGREGVGYEAVDDAVAKEAVKESLADPSPIVRKAVAQAVDDAFARRQEPSLRPTKIRWEGGGASGEWPVPVESESGLRRAAKSVLYEDAVQDSLEGLLPAGARLNTNYPAVTRSGKAMQVDAVIEPQDGARPDNSIAVELEMISPRSLTQVETHGRLMDLLAHGFGAVLLIGPHTDVPSARQRPLAQPSLLDQVRVVEFAYIAGAGAFVPGEDHLALETAVRELWERVQAP
jgi:hypothetical protein